MLNSLKLIKNYDKATHISRIPAKTNILENLEYIYMNQIGIIIQTQHLMK